jgi:hypothetical protein
VTETSDLKTIPQRLRLLKQILSGQTPIDGHIFSNPCSIRQAVEKLGGQVILIGEGSTGAVSSVYLAPAEDIKSPYRFALKKTRYEKEEDPFYGVEYPYLGMNNPYRPENVEVEILKRLNQLLLNNYTPHIPIYAGDFICRFPEEDEVARFTIVEQGQGDLNDFVRNYELVDEVFESKYGQSKTEVLRILIFQIVSALATIQLLYPNFKHNDLHMGNILYFKSKKSESFYRYLLGEETFSVPDIGVQIALWDFDFSSIGGDIDNFKSFDYMGRGYGIWEERNHYADMFKILNILRLHFTTNLRPPSWVQEAKDFFARVIPPELREENYNLPGLLGNGNLIYNVEYTTPREVLKDGYFDVLRGERQGKYLETYSTRQPLRERAGLPIHNEVLLAINCSPYEDRGELIPYYSYRDATLDDPLRVECYNTRENFADYIPAILTPNVQSQNKKFSRNLFGTLSDADNELIAKVFTNLMYQTVKQLYVPRLKTTLIGALLVEKAYFYVKHRHPIILEELKKYVKLSVPVVEIIDAYQQLTRFLISSGLEEQYLQQYQVRTLPGQS